MRELTEKNIKQIGNRFYLIADDGMVCTDGKEMYGTDIALAEGITPEGFYMIPYEDYARIVEAKRESLQLY